jgi:hypothetical protein
MTMTTDANAVSRNFMRSYNRKQAKRLNTDEDHGGNFRATTDADVVARDLNTDANYHGGNFHPTGGDDARAQTSVWDMVRNNPILCPQPEPPSIKMETQVNFFFKLKIRLPNDLLPDGLSWDASEACITTLANFLAKEFKVSIVAPPYGATRKALIVCSEREESTENVDRAFQEACRQVRAAGIAT